ncbi:MAG: CapA family protein [Bacilli bacterium]|nr:CapA family protein [Bacilli bacterium]
MAKKKRKRKLKKSVKIIAFFSVILIIAGVGLEMKNYYKKPTKEKVKEAKEEKKQPKDYKASIVMVGDALIHWGVYNDAKQNDGTYNFKPMLAPIKPISSKYDLAYYNQETILGGESLGYSSYPRFNSPQTVGDAFIDAGFNMVSLATNHTMDKGEQGVLNSVNYWKTKTNVAASGQWSSEEERTASIAKIYEKNNIKYAFISYTIWTNGLETPRGKEYLNNVYSEEKAKADIESVRDKVDFVIVAMHWGTEYSFKVDRKQEEIAKYLSNLGVDLIIGAHPHVIQTVEYINDGKTFVVYSLGNFISDQDDIDNFTGLMMEVTLKKHVDIDDKITLSVENPKAQLIYTSTTKRGGVNHDFKVVPYPQLNDTQLKNHNYYYEKYKAIVNERYPNLVWGLSGEE